MNGQITKERFHGLIDELKVKSDMLGDGWDINTFQSHKYLCKKVTQVVNSKDTAEGSLSPDTNIEESESETESRDCVLPGDGAFDYVEDSLEKGDNVGTDVESVVLTFDYHIVFSESYSVPVLYFNVYTASGALLSLDAMWSKIVPEYYRERLADDKWTFLTQTDHPYLGRPFYHLHPCHTDKLMSAASSIESVTPNSDAHYLVSWLSVVGPVIRLNVPLEYGSVT